MARRKNKKFIDPRYFMDEKIDVIKDEIKRKKKLEKELKSKKKKKTKFKYYNY